jgi:hypothetical protein
MRYVGHIDAAPKLEHVPLEPASDRQPRRRRKTQDARLCRVGDLLPLFELVFDNLSDFCREGLHLEGFRDNEHSIFEAAAADHRVFGISRDEKHL